MLSRTAKAVYYLVASPFMLVNGGIYRVFRAPRSGLPRVHLGPGQKNYIPGWINVDANMFTAKCDVWADLRHSLPFGNSTIDAFYSHHVVEHLPNVDGHFAEVYRCLKSNGAYRIAVPNADSAIRQFLSGDMDWFGGWPKNRRSIGGRLDNFILCGNEHLSILTESFLTELMRNVGFRNISRQPPVHGTDYPDLFNSCLSYEHETDFVAPHTLILEGVK